LTAFLPAMQFGVPPWNFDEETDQIAHRFVQIHIDTVAPYIYSLPLNNQPIIRPIWWAEPNNKLTFNISDQFLVGDDIIVAPVLDPGLTSRVVYLPPGEWYNPEDRTYQTGPAYITQNLTLDTIPYYYSKNMVEKLKLQ
jgi:alpha-glucosidase (family GH31 glycosyl hydrolase)